MEITLSILWGVHIYCLTKCHHGTKPDWKEQNDSSKEDAEQKWLCIVPTQILHDLLHWQNPFGGVFKIAPKVTVACSCSCMQNHPLFALIFKEPFQTV